jgi:hypothetical protein
VVYLSTVVTVQQVAEGEVPGAPARMEATLRIDRVLKGTPLPPVTETVVRYEQAGKAADDTPAGVSYRLAAGDRALVFAASFEKGFPIEMIVGAPRAVGLEVTALRTYLGAMDESAARLHGVTPAIRAQQTALYDRVLADLGARTP